MFQNLSLWESYRALWVGGIPILVTIYGFIREPVFRYIKNGNTGRLKYLVYQYTVIVDMRIPR